MLGNKMSYAHYGEALDCPECGDLTYELYSAINENGQKVLMCESCYDDSQIWGGQDEYEEIED